MLVGSMWVSSDTDRQTTAAAEGQEQVFRGNRWAPNGGIQITARSPDRLLVTQRPNRPQRMLLRDECLQRQVGE